MYNQKIIIVTVVLIVSGIVVFQDVTGEPRGEEVVLNVEWVLTKSGGEPVLEIRYDIIELHTNMTEGKITEREPAYVLLNTSGTHATPISLHNTPPEVLFIKGEVRNAVWQRYLK